VIYCAFNLFIGLCSDVFINLKLNRGTYWYISGVHFQKCLIQILAYFSTLNISTKTFLHLQMVVH